MSGRSVGVAARASRLRHEPRCGAIDADRHDPGIVAERDGVLDGLTRRRRARRHGTSSSARPGDRPRPAVRTRTSASRTVGIVSIARRSAPASTGGPPSGAVERRERLAASTVVVAAILRAVRQVRPVRPDRPGDEQGRGPSSPGRLGTERGPGPTARVTLRRMSSSASARSEARRPRTRRSRPGSSR